MADVAGSGAPTQPARRVPQGRIGSALDRVLHGSGSPPQLLNARERRFQGWEILIVLAVFPLSSAIKAVEGLAQHLQNGLPEYDGTQVTGNWLPLLFTILLSSALVAVVALVLFLLARSGEGAASINLDRHFWRVDAAFLLPVFLVVFLAPQWLGLSILHWTGLHPVAVYRSFNTSRGFFFGQLIARSISAGIVEEIVVLGFLVRRLRGRGVPVVAIVLIDAAVRVSYHVYYGYGVIPIAIWAFVSVLLYLRIQRLWPFIIGHIAYDVGVTWRDSYHPEFVIVAGALVVVTAVMMLRWARWSPVVHKDGQRRLAPANSDEGLDWPDWSD